MEWQTVSVTLTANLPINPCALCCCCCSRIPTREKTAASQAITDNDVRHNNALLRRCAAMTTGAHLNSMEDKFGGGRLDELSPSDCLCVFVLFISVQLDTNRQEKTVAPRCH